MIPSFDNAGDLSGPLTAGVFTGSYTVGVGANGYLEVSVSYVTSSANRVTSVTYNGVALTSLIVTSVGSISKLIQEVWYLLAPPSGTHNLVVNLSSTGVSILGIGVISLSGVNQTTPGLGTSVNDAASGSSAGSISCPSSSSNEFMVEHGFVNFTSGVGSGVSSPTVLTNQAYAGSAENPASGGAQTPGPIVMASYGPYPGGATSPGWTVANGGGTYGYILTTVAIAGAPDIAVFPSQRFGYPDQILTIESGD